MRLGKTIYFPNKKSWRAWLSKNHAKAKDIWLVYYKKNSGKQRISYNDAVEAALSFGWIDSTVKKIDAERIAQRFSPRRKNSSLSQANIERVRKLIAQKKMTQAGLAAIAHAFDPSRDRTDRFKIAPDILRALKAGKETWKNFKNFPGVYQRIRVGYIESRRRHGKEMFQKSLQHFIRMTAKNKRIGFIKE